MSNITNYKRIISICIAKVEDFDFLDIKQIDLKNIYNNNLNQILDRKTRTYGYNNLNQILDRNTCGREHCMRISLRRPYSKRETRIMMLE